MADIGPTLREARMHAQMEIADVESATKIRGRYLRALENEDWDVLPGSVYARTFLRTYADYLGLDSRVLVDEYKRRYELPSDQEIRPIVPVSRKPEHKLRPPRVPSWALVGAVLVAVAAALAIVGNLNNRSTPSTRNTQAETVQSRPAAHHKPAHHRANTVKLELVPTAAVYVCLVDGQGKELIPGQVFGPGQTIPTKVASKLMLSLGNNAVQMKVNGSAVKVNQSAGPIGFLLEPGTSRPLAPDQQPQCA